MNLRGDAPVHLSCVCGHLCQWAPAQALWTVLLIRCGQKAPPPSVTEASVPGAELGKIGAVNTLGQ